MNTFNAHFFGHRNGHRQCARVFYKRSFFLEMCAVGDMEIRWRLFIFTWQPISYWHKLKIKLMNTLTKMGNSLKQFHAIQQNSQPNGIHIHTVWVWAWAWAFNMISKSDLMDKNEKLIILIELLNRLKQAANTTDMRRKTTHWTNHERANLRSINVKMWI